MNEQITIKTYSPSHGVLYSIDYGKEDIDLRVPVLEVVGWCFGESPLRQMRVGGATGLRAQHLYSARPDVAQAFPHQPLALQSGFYSTIVLQDVPLFPAEITLIAEFEDGVVQPVITFNIPRRPVAQIDHIHLLPAEWNAWEREQWVIYTVITGRFDALLAPHLPEKEVRYVALVDDVKTFVPPPWEKQLFHIEARSTRVASKHPKFLPHLYFPDVQYSMYVDAQVYLHTNTKFVRLAAMHMGDFAAFSHGLWVTTRAEANEVLRSKLDASERVESGLAFQKTAGFPDQDGFMASGLLVRRHVSSVRQAGQTWWEMVNQYSHRDQLSVMYALWLHKVRQTRLPGTVWDNPFARLTRRFGKNSYIALYPPFRASFQPDPDYSG